MIGEYTVQAGIRSQQIECLADSADFIGNLVSTQCISVNKESKFMR
jgi:hypothetical protein